MKAILLGLALMLIVCLANAQQYGWVQVGQVGGQFNDLYTVDFVDSLHGWLYGLQSGFSYTINGGATWTQATSDGAGTNVSMLDTLTGWAVANGVSVGSISKTTDGGRSWIRQRLLFDRVYVGTKSLSIQKALTSGYTRISGVPDTGKVVETTNGGATWTERTISDSIRQLGKVQFTDSLHGWIVVTVGQTVPGLLRTVDGGVTWQFLPSPRGFPTISFIDTLRGWAASFSTAVIYHTTDGGFSWQQQYSFIGSFDDPSAKSISFVDSLNGWLFSEIFYEGDLASGIYRTTDGGWTWHREHAGQPRIMGEGLMLDRYHGWAVGSGGVVLAYRLVNAVPQRLPERPSSFLLRQNYPNPFNPATIIEYEVPEQTMVEIRVTDMQGRVVREPVHAEHEPGVYRIRFDATGLASGVYYYTMKAVNFSETKQMSFVK